MSMINQLGNYKCVYDSTQGVVLNKNIHSSIYSFI
jgi:hypothetical protein